MYIKERKGITFDVGLVPATEFEFWEEYESLKENINLYTRDINRLENDIANIRVNDVCPSCGQTIDTSHLEKVKADLQKSANSDALSHTVDYVLLNAIVVEEMATPSALLEHVAKRILDRIFTEDKLVTIATVAVSKINPPISGDVEMVTIELTEKRKN